MPLLTIEGHFSPFPSESRSVVKPPVRWLGGKIPIQIQAGRGAQEILEGEAVAVGFGAEPDDALRGGGCICRP